MTTTVRAKTKMLFDNLNKPSLVGLSYALRHPDTWPRGFRWNYSACETCAMGLAELLWKEKFDEPVVSEMARVFGIPYEEALGIFETDSDWAPEKRCGFLFLKKMADWNAVTPEMVADAIDEFLKTGKAP